MKKQMKKMVLAKETVRTLQGEQLTGLVFGGISTGIGSCFIACFDSQNPGA